jgi:DnaJ-class molecular chaperone
MAWGQMKNPHPVKVSGPMACPWCDGTGVFCRRTHLYKPEGRSHHPGCADCDGWNEWVECHVCSGTGGF